MEKTCLALVWMCQKLRHYLLASEIKILSRLNPLKYILEQPFLTGRIAKWQVLLMQYDLEYVSQKSVKGQFIADQLADFPLTEEIKVEDDFLDDRICSIQEVPSLDPFLWWSQKHVWYRDWDPVDHSRKGDDPLFPQTQLSMYSQHGRVWSSITKPQDFARLWCQESTRL